MPRPKQRQFFFTCLLLGVYLVAWWLQGNLPLNTDVSWFMHITSRLMGGGTYTHDFFEINPPLILYLYVPVVALSKALAINIIMAVRIYIFLLASVSLYSCHAFIQKIFHDEDAFLVPLLTLALAAVFLVLPVNQFAQRENLIVILTMPYILGVAMRLQGHAIKPATAVLTGILAGLGFAIKPFYFIALLLIELYYCFERRALFSWVRAEIVAIVGVVACYLLVIFVFHRDYIFSVIPRAASFYFRGYGISYSVAIFSCLLLSFSFVFLLVIQQRNKHSYKPFAMTLLIALTGYLFAYLMQHARLYYHLLPALSLEIILLVFGVGLMARRALMQKKDYIYISIIGALIFVFLAYNATLIWTLLVFAPLSFYGYMTVLFATLFYIAEQDKNPYRILGHTAFIVLTGYVFSCLVQHDTWNTHRLLLTIMMFMLLFCVAVPQSGARHKLHYTFVGLLAMLVFAFPCWLAYVAYQRDTGYEARYSKLIHFMQANAQHKPVYFFTTATYHAFPSVDYANAIPVSRIQSFAWIRGLVLPIYANPDHRLTVSQQDFNNFYINLVAEDLDKQQPVFVFVDVSDHKESLGSLQFDHVRYLSQNAHFQQAWLAYQYLLTIEDPLYKFQVYQRRQGRLAG